LRASRPRRRRASSTIEGFRSLPDVVSARAGSSCARCPVGEKAPGQPSLARRIVRDHHPSSARGIDRRQRIKLEESLRSSSSRGCRSARRLPTVGANNSARRLPPLLLPPESSARAVPHARRLRRPSEPLVDHSLVGFAGDGQLATASFSAVGEDRAAGLRLEDTPSACAATCQSVSAECGGSRCVDCAPSRSSVGLGRRGCGIIVDLPEPEGPMTPSSAIGMSTSTLRRPLRRCRPQRRYPSESRGRTTRGAPFGWPIRPHARLGVARGSSRAHRRRPTVIGATTDTAEARKICRGRG